MKPLSHLHKLAPLLSSQRLSETSERFAKLPRRLLRNHHLRPPYPLDLLYCVTFNSEYGSDRFRSVSGL